MACNIWLDFSACPNISGARIRRIPTYELICGLIDASGNELDMRRGQILVVADDAALRRVAEVGLGKMGYPTATAADATEALEILKDEPRDLAISRPPPPGM